MTTAHLTYPTFAAMQANRLDRRRAAIEALKRAEAVARCTGGRLVGFGSVVEGGFHERSNLDVAVRGLEAAADGRVTVEVELALADAGYAADVIPERFLLPGLAERVQARGREPNVLC